MFFADDTFKGVVLYPNSFFTMRDKLAHFLAGFFLVLIFLATQRWTGWVLTPTQLSLILLSIFIGWELVEFVRFKMGYWIVADLFSWKDVIMDILGALTAYVLIKT